MQQGGNQEPTITISKSEQKNSSLRVPYALDFIFKPHGDAADTESIILTREQYRMLLPQGERQATLESLKMLLASRPVVYLGFGLRNPDFSYLRDVLANTYKGGDRDHYAIMPGVSSDQVNYWRRSYGIHAALRAASHSHGAKCPSLQFG